MTHVSAFNSEAVRLERVRNEADATHTIIEFWFAAPEINIDAQGFDAFADMPQLTNYTACFKILLQYKDLLRALKIRWLIPSMNTEFDYHERALKISREDFTPEGLGRLMVHAARYLPSDFRPASRSTTQDISAQRIAEPMPLRRTPRRRAQPPKDILDELGEGLTDLVDRVADAVESMCVDLGLMEPPTPPPAIDALEYRKHRLRIAGEMVEKFWPGTRAVAADRGATVFHVMNGVGFTGNRVTVSSVPSPLFHVTLEKMRQVGGRWVVTERTAFTYAGR